ncbi:MAG: ThuA domain-containing protein, partial [Tannerellaceae bacterium]|nr:ThuA domain-containing protein [Tannerellaceae bacterium]
MKHSFYASFLACSFALAALAGCSPAKEKPHVLLITGGHAYEEEPFDRMLAKLPITYDKAEHPNAYPLLKAGEIEKYDVVLLYDMPKEIPEEAQADFIAMLEKGKGLVVLHHAFCSYDFWPEYTKIAGGRYHHYPWTENGLERPPSAYRHGVTFDVKIADARHPVTRGISDFRITDETYRGTEILPDVHPLLTTEAPTSAPLLAWTHRYGHAAVVTLTLGHDSLAW